MVFYSLKIVHRLLEIAVGVLLVSEVIALSGGESTTIGVPILLGSSAFMNGLDK